MVLAQNPGLHLADLRRVEPDRSEFSAARLAAGRGFGMYASRNLVARNGANLGALCVLDTHPRVLSARQLRLLERLAGQVVLLLDIRRTQLLAERAQAELLHLATRDPLTGLANRVAWDLRLSSEAERHLRYKTPFAIVAFDLDHFKAVNDHHGHAAGDVVLQHVADALKRSLRRADLAARLGGDEFVILLANTTQAQAALLARRWCSTLARQPVPLDGATVNVTCSVGVASTDETAATPQSLQRTADMRSYRAKQQGRNQVVAT